MNWDEGTRIFHVREYPPQLFNLEIMYVTSRRDPAYHKQIMIITFTIGRARSMLLSTIPSQKAIIEVLNFGARPKDSLQNPASPTRSSWGLAVCSGRFLNDVRLMHQRRVT